MTEDPTAPPKPAGRTGLLAAVLLAAQAVALLGFAVYYIVELIRGDGDDLTRVLMFAMVILVFAAALLLVARALWQGSSWSRSATVVWQLLLLPVGISLLQSQRALIGGAVLVMATVTLGCLAADRRSSWP